MTLEQLSVDALAAARLTRLVSQDTITETLRKRYVGWVLDRASSQPATAITYHERLFGVRSAGVTPADIEDVFDDFEEREKRDVPKLAVLPTCPWCVGFYVAVGVSVARAVAPRSWERVARVLALSQLAGVIDTH